MSFQKARRKQKAKTISATQATVIVAIIGLIGTVITLLFSFDPFIRVFTPATETASSAETVLVPKSPLLADINSPVPTLIAAHTSVPTEPVIPIIPSETITPASTPTTGLPIGMQVKITANQTSGRSPLTVKLDARDSFLRAPDGTIFECRKGACSYVWYVYLNNVEFTKPQETRGTIEFRFEKKGTYFVSVYICHGAENPICGNSGTAVIVE